MRGDNIGDDEGRHDQVRIPEDVSVEDLLCKTVRNKTRRTPHAGLWAIDPSPATDLQDIPRCAVGSSTSAVRQANREKQGDDRAGPSIAEDDRAPGTHERACTSSPARPAAAALRVRQGGPVKHKGVFFDHPRPAPQAKGLFVKTRDLGSGIVKYLSARHYS